MDGEQGPQSVGEVAEGAVEERAEEVEVPDDRQADGARREAVVAAMAAEDRN